MHPGDEHVWEIWYHIPPHSSSLMDLHQGCNQSKEKDRIGKNNIIKCLQEDVNSNLYSTE